MELSPGVPQIIRVPEACTLASSQTDARGLRTAEPGVTVYYSGPTVYHRARDQSTSHDVTFRGRSNAAVMPGRDWGSSLAV